jgi:molecular chaperone GrpE
MDEQQGETPPGPGQKSDAPPRGAQQPGGQEPVSITRAQYEELKTLAAERDEFLKRLQRAVADCQNLQKLMGKRRDEASRQAIRDVTLKFVPLADSLASALELAARTKGAEELAEGLQVAAREFYRVLEAFNIRPMEAVGKPFDPRYHEAVLQEPAQGVPPNTVVRELKKGFLMGSEVIRPAQVTVAAPEKKKE